MLRKSDPWLFKTRRISTAQFRHHSRYVSLFCLSEYFPYLIPRLYGGDVTVTSIHWSGRCDMPATQSPSRRSCAKKPNSSCASESLIRTIRTVCTTDYLNVQKNFPLAKSNSVSTEIEGTLECFLKHPLISASLVAFNIPLNSFHLVTV